jgi:hypothetical protein
LMAMSVDDMALRAGAAGAWQFGAAYF